MESMLIDNNHSCGCRLAGVANSNTGQCRAVAPSPAGVAMAGPVFKKLALLVRSNPG